VVVGGFNNLIQGAGMGSIGYSAILGGRDNLVDNNWAVVTGGRANHSAARGSVVSGGNGRTAPGEDDWVAGVLFQEN